jgi:hypothetical protein
MASKTAEDEGLLAHGIAVMGIVLVAVLFFWLYNDMTINDGFGISVALPLVALGGVLLALAVVAVLIAWRGSERARAILPPAVGTGALAYHAQVSNAIVGGISALDTNSIINYIIGLIQSFLGTIVNALAGGIADIIASIAAALYSPFRFFAASFGVALNSLAPYGVTAPIVAAVVISIALIIMAYLAFIAFIKEGQDIDETFDEDVE